MDEQRRRGIARFEVTQAQATGAWLERRRLSSALREVIEHLVTTEAPEVELRAAAEALERYAELLRSHPRRSGWDSLFHETAVAGDVNEFFDMSPLIGLSNPIAPPIRMRVEGDRVFGEVTFGVAYEGPPGHVHGGYVAAAFDEVLGYTQSLTEQPGMTGRLVIHYRSPTPLRTDLVFEGRVLSVSGRKIFTHGTLRAGETLCAEAEGLFIRVAPEKMRELARQRVGATD